jgi:hypothetical protein
MRSEKSMPLLFIEAGDWGTVAGAITFSKKIELLGGSSAVAVR